jgi:putative inorganic carbon (hco3(-)) transporter
MLGTLILLIVIMMALMSITMPFLAVTLHLWYDLVAPHAGFYNHLSSIGVSTITAACVLIGLVIGHRGKIKINRFVVLMTIYMLWFCFTYFFAIAPAAADHKIDRAIKSFVPLIICMAMLTTRRRIEILSWMYVACVCIYGARAGMFTLVSGGGYGVNATGNEGSVLFESSTFAVALLSVIPLMSYLYKNSILMPWVSKFGWVFIITGLLNLVAVIGSYARSGIATAVAMTTITVLILPNRFRNAFFCIVVAGIFLSLAPAAWFDRMSTISTYDTEASASGRIKAWGYAWRLAQDRWTGGGFGAFSLNAVADPGGPQDQTRIVESHSWFFEAMGEHGFIGCFILTSIFLLCVISAFNSGFRKSYTPLTQDDMWQRNLGRSMFVSMIGLLTGGLFIGIASHTFTYILPAVCCGLFTCSRELIQNGRNKPVNAPKRVNP